MNEPWQTPNFTAPDFTQPTLQQTDLAIPGFTLPDPTQPGIVIPLSLWPANLDQPATNQPAPASPDLTTLALPTTVHALSVPSYEPEVVMGQRPGELDPAALKTLLDGADATELPPGISYPQLYSMQDEMDTRKRHLGMLELGLERTEGAEP
ncbi:MAG: hypothetical protein ACRDHZ_22570 [Ktedonobacteraceae bacterium]